MLLVQHPTYPPLLPFLSRCPDAEFTQVDSGKMMCVITEASKIKEFAISLLKPEIPEGYAVGVFYACEPFTQWNYLGRLSMESPTSFYRASWNNTESVRSPRRDLRPPSRLPLTKLSGRPPL